MKYSDLRPGNVLMTQLYVFLVTNVEVIDSVRFDITWYDVMEDRLVHLSYSRHESPRIYKNCVVLK